MADGSTIDLTHVKIVFGGHVVLEHPKGAIVSIAYNDDQVKMLQGIDSANFIKTLDLSAVVTVNMMQASVSNDIFSAFHRANLVTPGGLARTLTIKDLNGSSLYVAPRGMITKWPDAAWSDSGEIRAWSIACTRLIPNVGGIAPTPVL